MQYGDLEWNNEPISYFEGQQNTEVIKGNSNFKKTHFLESRNGKVDYFY